MLLSKRHLWLVFAGALGFFSGHVSAYAGEPSAGTAAAKADATPSNVKLELTEDWTFDIVAPSKGTTSHKSSGTKPKGKSKKKKSSKNENGSKGESSGDTNDTIFCKGRIGLRNAGTTPLKNIRVVVTLFDIDGMMIDETAPLAIDSLLTEKPAIKKFFIRKGEQFVEVRVVVSDVAGNILAEFSSQSGKLPVNLATAPGGLAVLTRFVEKSEDKDEGAQSTTLTCRIKNMNPYPLTKLSAILDFSKGVEGGKVVTALLDTGYLNPGETRTYSDIALRDVPEGVTNCTIKLKGEKATELELDSEPIDPADEISIGRLNMDEQNRILRFSIVSRKVNVGPDCMKITVELTNAAGEVIHTIEKTQTQAFPLNKRIPVEISLKGAPEFKDCNVSTEYEFKEVIKEEK